MRRFALLLFALAVATATPAALAQLAPVGRPEARGTVKVREVPPFRLGIVGAERPAAMLARVDPFRRHLAGTLGRDVAVTTFPDEAALTGALVAGRIDYAPLTALGFARASRLCDCVEPLAAPREADRAPGWHAVILANRTSGLSRAEDLAGKHLAVAPKAAIGTRRLPMMLLERAGLVADKAPLLVETAGPEAALRALVEGRADAALVWSSLAGEREEGWSRGTLAEAVARGTARAEDFTLVWSSPLLPLGPHTVRAALDEPTKRRLREMLVQLDIDPDVYEAIERDHAGGFVRVGAPSYRPFVDLLTPPEPPAAEPATDGQPSKG
jgi:phosphonate transport system substrate-binding protein